MRTQRIFTGIGILLFPVVTGLAQAVHQVPFASTGNAIELTVANTSSIPQSAVRVEAKNLPDWLRFVSTETILQTIDAQGEEKALFTFSVDKSAPINEKHILLFSISSPSGGKWTKEISISVNPPDQFELYQNYPNPFNPTTTISYTLPRASRVVLSIYNLLGQEVTTLLSADRAAGHHQEVWNAVNQSSGMYIYQLDITSPDGMRQSFHKSMILLK